MEETIKKQLSKALVEPWLAALRSGEYMQGTGVLEGGNRYCCLGVYNKIHDIDNFGEKNYVGVQDAIGGKLVDHCIIMNDQDYKTFPEIADYIEQNYELV